MPSQKKCPVCSHVIATGGLCPNCLLATGNDAGQSRAERIFQSALALEPEKRKAFIAQATEDGEVLEEVEMLLAGYLEAGGDTAYPTLGQSPNSRAAWAIGAEEEPGTVIGHFQLVRLIGEGGMGTVWEATQREPFQRKVAFKLIKEGMDTREMIARFERERQILASLNHPNIAKVFEAGASALGRPYFAMELAIGPPITSFCFAENLTTRERLELFTTVCDAIDHAHAEGVVHRDLKPSNILMVKGHPKVIDFGIAKATRSVNQKNPLYTRHAQVLGTPAYMSPEQASGSTIDSRSDIYSLGVLLYELLSGVLPFDADRLSTLSDPEIQKILQEEIPDRPSRKTDAHVEGDLDWIVLKALAKEPGQRYQSAGDLAQDLRRFLTGNPIEASPPGLFDRVGRLNRRHPILLPAVAAVALLLPFVALFHRSVPPAQTETRRQPMSGILEVEYLGEENDGLSIKLTFPFNPPNIQTLKEETSYGDYGLSFSPVKNDIFEGILVSSVAENGRPSETGDPIRQFATTSTGINGDLGAYYIAVFKSPCPADPYQFETNSNVAFGWFPYEEFRGGLTLGRDLGEEITTLHGSAETGIRFGQELTLENGRYRLDLTNLGGHSKKGILLVNSAKNLRFHAQSQANPDGSFEIVNCDSPHQEYDSHGSPIAFVYLGLDDLEKGKLHALARVNSDGSTDVTGGDFILTKGPIGEWHLQIPDHTPATGTLLISPEMSSDHFVTYQWRGDRWIIQSRDINGMAAPSLQDGKNLDTDIFSFAFLKQ